MRKQRNLDYIARYDRENCKQFCLKLNKKYDAAVIERLEQVGNKLGYIKALIIADIMRGAANGSKRTYKDNND